MATESFSKTFMVDRRSEQCIEDILKSTKLTVINCKKSFKIISKDELRDLFGGKKER